MSGRLACLSLFGYMHNTVIAVFSARWTHGKRQESGRRSHREYMIFYDILIQ
jgi:hypothetical protein